MNIAKLLSILLALAPIAGVNAGKINVAIAFLQILSGGEINYSKVAEVVEAAIPGAGEDSAKMTAIVAILKILGEK